MVRVAIVAWPPRKTRLILRRRELVVQCQGLTGDTGSLATRLRPVSLGEFGRIENLQGFIAEFGALYPQPELYGKFAVEDHDIPRPPRPLRMVIDRIVLDTLNRLVSHTEADRVEVRWEHDADTLGLGICENSTGSLAHGPADEAAGVAFAAMQECTLLSAGEYSISTW